MGEYGGRWRRDGEYILGEDGKPVSCAPRVRDRVVADHNALLDVPNPAGVAKLVAACKTAQDALLQSRASIAVEFGVTNEIMEALSDDVLRPADIACRDALAACGVKLEA